MRRRESKRPKRVGRAWESESNELKKDRMTGEGRRKEAEK